MKHLALLTLLCLTLFVGGCKKESMVQPTSDQLVEGNWEGMLGSSAIDLHFIEGEFEGYPTVTGSAYFVNGKDTLSYQVMNGTNDRIKTVQFSLYKVPAVTKEEYHMNGNVSGTTINGTYQKLNHNGEIIDTGTWNVQRIH